MEAFHIDVKVLIAQIINFAIVLFVLVRFAYKPILKMLDERRDAIAQGLKDAEDAKTRLSGAEKDSAAKLEAAYAEAKKISDNAKAEAKKDAAEIVNKANEQASRIIEAAEQEAHLAKQKALKEAKGELSELIVLSLNKVIDTEIDASIKNKITARAIEEI